MIYTDERIELICKLSPSDGHALLERGRAGDAEALGDWTVHAAYTHLKKEGGFDHAHATENIKTIFSTIDLKPIIVP